MTFLLYGANGYTGKLVARVALDRGLRPILAGRNAAEVEAEARELQLPYRVFGLEDTAAVDQGLEGASAVLHCAGPFSRTSEPVVAACLRAKIHYLDITGEIEVFESIARRDAEARDTGVMLLPGAGFDVVPSDCLSAHLKRRLPSATHLRLALHTTGRASRGTLTTVVEHLGRGSVVRRDGRMIAIPAGSKSLDVDFGDGRARRCVSIAWGDVATAFRSTGIPNLEVYLAAPAKVRAGLALSNSLSPLLRWPWAKKLAIAWVRRGPEGPTAEERAANRCVIWGEASDGTGRRAVSRVRTPDGYATTALSAIACIERVLAGHALAGVQTPSTAYGADFILGIPGVAREDLEDQPAA